MFDPNAIDPAAVVQCSENATCGVVWSIAFTLILVIIILTGFAYTTLLERKVIAWLQQRVGPNRTGPAGLLQPLADAVKLIFKEDIIPEEADKPVYYLAPILKVVPVLIVVAVIPFGPDILIPWFDGNWYQVPLSVADVNVGVLYLLGVTSLATYGMVLAGWSSNNKYATLGGLRASAQMISYELSLGLAMAVPVMIVGSMRIGDIVNAQPNVWDWLVFQNPLAAGILVITLFAEVGRAPFDLPEAEQELTAGYMTEYSGMKFAIFMMAEYVGMIAVSIISISLYFGGYNLFPVDNVPLLGPLVLIGKVVLALAFFVWVRGTLPRIRYDRLMAFGWKILLPLSLVSVAWTAISVVLGDVSGNPAVYGISSLIFFIIVVAGGYLFLSGSQDDSEIATPETDLMNDPVVTGEPRSIGWILLNLIGGLVAVPFLLVKGLLGALEGLGSAGADTVTSDEVAIEPVEPAGD
ncbi:NADH-quinone oxidoreductase subunit NuoH [Phototrophicus methaneseepsis]|uniref:NADH-quinone oxidoreductase subunit H n=2 Tax=Phototrophicus methaneseepsis TaxID=2710758 RepID=A0A7S8EDY5_9CHLR|nr:NADH-quinone oxidoreductase subunit NuoH [Phototrophicus methaneseepsis]